MKSVGLICLLAIIAYVGADTYNDKYDNMDIKEVMANRRLMMSYLDCILEKGRCTPEGNSLKAHFKEALQNYCQKCTEKQKEITKLLSVHVHKEYPESWKELCKFYDPEMKYVPKWMKEIGLE